MTYTNKRADILGTKRELWKSTFLIAILAASALFIPYIIYDNGYFLFYGDFNVQQIPFYKMCHDMIREGRTGWNWNTDLGVNFVGSYSFYLLGSPFFWLTIPFPSDFVPYLIGPLLILKFGCAALTSYFYIRRFTRTPESARLGAILYAFSGFSVYNIFFNHFHEAIIVFPLLLLSIELLLTENRRGVFAVAVALAAVTNYFFFFGMVVFCAIYWMVRVATGCYKLTLRRTVAFFLEAFIGLALSAFLLLPSAAALSTNSRLSEIMSGWGAILYGKEQIYANIIEVFFFPPDLPARPVFFPKADVKWSSLGGWLPLFSMVGVFAFIKNKRKSWQRKLILISAFMAFVPILNSAFYMFNEAYYARWYYMPILIMCVATPMAIEDKEIDWKPSYFWVLGITLAFSAVIGFFPTIKSDGTVVFGLYTDAPDPMYTFRFFAACIIALGSLVILGLLLKFRKTEQKNFIKVATVAVCIISVVYSSLFVGLGKTHGFESHEIMIPQLLEGEVTLGQSDDNVFRIDVYDGVDNTGMYLGLYSINCFHSIVPPSVTEFYEYIGEERGVGSRPTTDSYAARSLLSCKYLLSRDEGDGFEENDGYTRMPGWSYYGHQSGYSVYVNDNYIPFGFTYKYYITESDMEHYEGGMRSNIMLKAMMLNSEQIEKYSGILTNIADKYELGDSYGDKEIISVSNDAFAADCKTLSDTAVGMFRQTDDGFVCDYPSEKENLLFFSVPYDEGWTAYVNGEETEIEKVNVGFMAVKIGKGQNKVEFKYKTPMMKSGIIISIIALVILIIYVFVSRSLEKMLSEPPVYPEGDELIEKWKEYENTELSAITENAEETAEENNYGD